MVICGTASEIRGLFCVLAQYAVRPDHCICPDEDLPEMSGVEPFEGAYVTEPLMTLRQKASLFGPSDINSKTINMLYLTARKEEVEELLASKTKDPLLCCIGGKILETGRHVPKDIDKAIRWYRKASKMGVKLAKRKIVSLKKSIR